MRAVLDIETDLSWKTIKVVGIYDERGESIAVFSAEELNATLSRLGTTSLIMHNGVAFDLPRLYEIWGWEPRGLEIIDTLLLGRLYDPSIDGGHSLKQWALRAGQRLKEDFDPADFDGPVTQKMVDYCLADCAATYDVYLYIDKLLADDGFSDYSRELEHKVAEITAVQERNGFMLDFDKACTLYNDHDARMSAISDELQAIFPPIVEERWSEKTGKQLKDKVTVFNVGSRQQVAERLAAKGAKWSELTPTGKPVVNEKTLAANAQVPEASKVLEYMTLQKRVGMLKSWIDAVKDDGRIHGRVNTCGAVTGRMTHSSPNMAQIPSESEYRSCFTVPEGYKLVGIDASGLELRMLAHYMKDEAYTDLILHGDIHTYNQEAAGLPSRNDAKTFIYAFLYGAGDAKIGSIVGGSAAEGAKLKDKFLKALPSLRALLLKVQRIASTGTVPALDGRRVRVRSEHAALNSLLQSAGALVMKRALTIAVDKLAAYGYPYKLVAQVHDEFQVEVPEEYAERVGVVFRNAIRQAGRDFEMRCPLDGEYQIGDSWAETH
jgi:DNA polymerase I